MKKFFVIFLLFWHGIAFANEAEFYRGVDAADSGNYEQAFKIWQPLAERGDPYAQFNIALMYVNGQGVSQNHEESAKWFRKSAEQGVAEAQFNLGVMYNKGRGVTENYKEAVKWYRKAAEQGFSDAQFNLAIMYGNGFGVTENYTHAYMWLAIAKANGDEYAGEMMEKAREFLTSASLEEAQRLALQCMNSNYEKCD